MATKADFKEKLKTATKAEDAAKKARKFVKAKMPDEALASERMHQDQILALNEVGPRYEGKVGFSFLPKVEDVPGKS